MTSRNATRLQVVLPILEIFKIVLLVTIFLVSAVSTNATVSSKFFGGSDTEAAVDGGTFFFS